MNLIEGLQEELERNKELLKLYEEIPQGKFGATMIKLSIKNAENAIANNDTLEMIRCHKDLQENE